MKLLFKRKGFSLVELLIVVTLMALLAGGLVLSLGGGLDKARASKVVSQLSNLRAAVALYQADMAGTAESDKAPTAEKLKPYLQGESVEYELLFWPSGGAENDHWYAGLKGVTPDSGLAKRLATMASSNGLLKGDGAQQPNGAYDGGDIVWVKVR